MSETPSIAFAGTPAFAVPSLACAAKLGNVPWVLTQPDRRAGRGRKLTASPVKTFAVDAGIEVLQPASLKHWSGLEGRPRPELLIVAAYGLLLPQWLLSLPTVACLNVHASLLPRWRGAAPIQRALEAGDTQTGVCIMDMVKALDAGPVYHRKAIAIGGDATSASLHDELAELGAAALAESVPKILAGTLKPEPQDDSAVTYARKIEKSEAQLNFSEPATVLERKVRAFNPWPVAQARFAGEILRIWQASVVTGVQTRSPGEVAAISREGVVVGAGADALRLERVQRPGGRAIDAVEWARGTVTVGNRFG